MKHLLLLTSLFLLCSCAVKKEQQLKQSINTHIKEWKADSIEFRFNSNTFDIQNLKITQFRLSPPDSSQQQFIETITVLESETKQTTEFTTELSKKSNQEQTIQTNKNIKSTNKLNHSRHWSSFIWIIVLILVYKLLKNNK